MLKGEFLGLKWKLVLLELSVYGTIFYFSRKKSANNWGTGPGGAYPIRNYDTFAVNSIEWTFVAHANNVAFDGVNSGTFPLCNTCVFIVQDPTANLDSLEDVQKDMKRYLPPSTGDDTTLNKATEIATSLANLPRAVATASTGSRAGIIYNHPCTLFNKSGPLGTSRNDPVVIGSTWRMTEAVAGGAPDKGE